MTPFGKPIPPDTRILVIDDNADAALIVSLSLRMSGFSVQSGASGSQALAMAESWLPQLVLLDISMPGMDGYEACALLRRQVWGQPMVLVALTGYGQTADQERSRTAGFDAHLVKPVDLARLPGLLMELIHEKR